MLPLAFALALAIEPPVLTVDTGQPKLWSREALLTQAAERRVHVVGPDFGGTQDLLAVPLYELFGAEPGPGTVEASCSDGFVAELPRQAALQRDPKKPIAYLAVDPADGSWPAGDAAHPSPGPFAVVWSLPPGQTVPRELWPYQVVKLGLGGSLPDKYPALVPAGAGAASRGFQVFAESCLPCHQLNSQGPATLGPDLNVPQSPIEYFGKTRLAAFVRDPQSLRHWPSARMPPFPPSVLSDSQLDDLIAYLADRAKHR